MLAYIFLEIRNCNRKSWQNKNFMNLMFNLMNLTAILNIKILEIIFCAKNHC